MTPALYRKWIREVLKKAEPFAVPAPALEDAVQAMAGGGFDLSDYRRAIEWNLAEDLIRSSKNHDTDEHEWKLTPKGTAKKS